MKQTCFGLGDKIIVTSYNYELNCGADSINYSFLSEGIVSLFVSCSDFLLFDLIPL